MIEPIRPKVFVYGTLKRGMALHQFMEDERFIREDTLSGFIMMSLGPFPAIKDGDGTVKGEIFEVSMDKLNELDQVENGYERRIVQTDSGSVAYVYVGMAWWHGRLIPDGEWSDRMSTDWRLRRTILRGPDSSQDGERYRDTEDDEKSDPERS